ncbi:MAG TPA: allantoinase AllB [Pyrinomonadaceae bacterium]|nr:allantoinase AllB [Pyrinomonadaceae bacterium]
MSAPALVIRGRRVVVSDDSHHRVEPASIHILNGCIQQLKSYDDTGAAPEVVTASEDSTIMPGLVDSHVHINEPGRTDWEGFATATRAAAAGGVTTLIDMPLNSIPPTTTLSGLEEKLKAARDQCHVDVGFWGGVVPGNTGELGRLLAAGVVGFKCFLIHSGVDEFPNVTEADLRQSMPELTRLGAVLIVHAELPGPISRTAIPASPDPTKSTDRNLYPARYRTFLDSRPRAAENEAVALMIELAREFGTKVHIVHHSSADALPMLLEAKSSGLPLTVETCPHYLCFAAEEIPDGATEFKCCPPIREAENREQLWHALADGTIDMVVSDHSPCPPPMKLRQSGDFLSAWGGISSLQLRLPVMWTMASRRGFSIETLADWLCTAPARLTGLERTKGRIAEGCDADIVIWNARKEFRVTPELLQHRHKLTPYAGQNLKGVIEKTFLRGKKIYDEGQDTERAGVLLKVKR